MQSGLSGLYYLGALLFRRALRRTLDRWIGEGFRTGDADEIIELIARGNSRRIYQLD